MSELFVTDHNYLAILVAGISNMVLGFLWYGPIFGKVWMGLIGKTVDELNPNPIIYVVSFLLSLLMAFVLSTFIHHVDASIQSMTLLLGVLVALLAWVGFVGTSTFQNNMYSGISKRLYVIDYGYVLAAMLIQGAIVGVWR
jgi:phosphoglycerol transferase MdoB-like AlkP superfamily enzyme